MSNSQEASPNIGEVRPNSRNGSPLLNDVHPSAMEAVIKEDASTWKPDMEALKWYIFAPEGPRLKMDVECDTMYLCSCASAVLIFSAEDVRLRYQDNASIMCTVWPQLLEAVRLHVKSIGSILRYERKVVFYATLRFERRVFYTTVCQPIASHLATESGIMHCSYHMLRRTGIAYIIWFSHTLL